MRMASRRKRGAAFRKAATELYGPLRVVGGLEAGRRYGYWTLVEEAPRRHSQRRFLCECVCGRRCERTVSGTGMFSKSCGCKNSRRLSRYVTHDGYVRVYDPAHPNATGCGRVLEHVKVMSAYLGRPLRKGETVHHKDGDRANNSIENLELWQHNHGKGQRVVDKVKAYTEFLESYGYKVKAPE